MWLFGVSGIARWEMGLDGWTEDFDRALAMARTTDPVSQATLVAYNHVGLSRGVLLADDAALTEIDEALQVAERSSEDVAVVFVRLALGTALIYHNGGDRQRGFKVLAELRDMCANQRYVLNAVPYFDVYAAREKAALGDLDGAVQQLRTITDEVFKTRHLGNADVAAEALVETLLERGCDGDLAEAEAAIDRMEICRLIFVGRHAISRCCGCVPCCRRAVVRKRLSGLCAALSKRSRHH
jgi:adenylate cyclase